MSVSKLPVLERRLSGRISPEFVMFEVFRFPDRFGPSICILSSGIIVDKASETEDVSRPKSDDTRDTCGSSAEVFEGPVTLVVSLERPVGKENMSPG